MHIPAFWSRVRLDTQGRVDPKGPAIAFGWSDQSHEDAVAHGLERASRVAEAIRAGRVRDLPRTWSYYPLDRPLLEPVLEWLTDERGDRVGALTRNAYGAVVLNAARVAFVDIDLPPPEPVGWLGRLFGRAPEPPRDDVQERVRAFLARRPGLGLRLYRTAAGYRALETTRTWEPASLDTTALLSGLGADPLYVRLTKTQACFRARLTPKPWRLAGCPSPQTHYFPWDDDPERRERFEQSWVNVYDTFREGHAVCTLVGHFGEDAIDAAVAPILELHDRWTRTSGDLA